MPPPGMAGAAACFLGTSATMASVVPATDAAPCSAAQEGTIRFAAAPLTLARECLAWPWTGALLRAVDGSFGSE